MSALKNPFPGMNPYLQRHWSDVHTRLITFISEALSGELPDDLAARTEERITVGTEEVDEHYRADVAVVDLWKGGFPPVWTPPGAGGQAVNVAEPIIYVGESLNLRQRLQHQFTGQPLRTWKHESAELRVRFFTAEPNTPELLAYQCLLIREHKPKLNVRDIAV